MKKILKRLRPLILLVTILALNACQEEDIDYADQNGAGDGTSKIISLKELKEMPKAFEKFQDVIQSHLASRSIAYSDFGFTIDTDAIVLYSDGAFESLTFMVTLDKDRGYLENLILNKEDDGTYSVYYSVYNLSEQDKEKVANNLNVDINGKYFLCPLPGFKASSLMAKGGDGIIRHDGKCFVEKLVRVNSYRNIPGQLEFSRFEGKVVEVPCPGPEQDIDYGYTYYNGGNGGGGTPTNIYFNTPTGHEGVPPPAISINGPIAGGGHPRPVITRPFIDVRSDDECKKIKNVMAMGTFRQQLQTLAVSVNDPVNEHGIGLYANDSTTVAFTPAPEIDITGNAFLKYNAVAHVHNNPPYVDVTQVGGTYSIFSYDDIVALLMLVKRNRIYPDTFISTLSTKKGTHYVLTISSINRFKEFYYHKLNVLANLSPQDAAKYGRTLQRERDMREKYYDINDGKIKRQNSDNEYVLEQFLNFMYEADMGLTLYETDATFTYFNKVSKSGINNPVKRTPCK